MGHKGFVKLHRQILDSEIMNMPPVTRELWQYILLNAQHKPFKNLKEGELFMRFKDVQDALCWYVGYRKMTYKKYDLTRSIRRLCESNMIATTKATHGILVKVLNYSLYQGSENGEGNNESLTKATRKQRSCININKNDKNVKNDINTSQLFSKDCLEYKIASYLEKKIIKNNPVFKPRTESQLQKWCVVIDRLIRLDNAKTKDIKTIIDWVYQDEFWSSNIMSAKKLREHYPKLWKKAVDDTNNRGGLSLQEKINQDRRLD
jgi:hypothetical protein